MQGKMTTQELELTEGFERKYKTRTFKRIKEIKDTKETRK